MNGIDHTELEACLTSNVCGRYDNGVPFSTHFTEQEVIYQRMRELRDKVHSGELTEEEYKELDKILAEVE